MQRTKELLAFRLAAFALILWLAGCDSTGDKPCTTEGLNADDFYFVACLNGELFISENADLIIDTLNTNSLYAEARIGYPDFWDSPCNPYPCRLLSLRVKGQATANPGDIFTTTNNREGLQTFYVVGYADAPFAWWGNTNREGRPVAAEPTWLRITEFDTLNHVMGGTFELTLPRTSGTLTSEEAGVPLPDTVRFREGRFRLPIWQPSGP